MPETRAQTSTTPDLGALDGFHDAGHDSREQFLSDVLAGLDRPRKSLPCKYFYDEHGSRLFDRICALDAYYPTRTEIAVLADNAAPITAAIGAHANIVEFGSGSSVKIRILLDALHRPRSYIPVDVSREHMIAATRTLAADYPALTVIPVCADYTRPFTLPAALGGAPRTGFFPGSTIGNFSRADARDFLVRASGSLGPKSGLLVGVDLKKPVSTLVAAYDDEEGVTAAFNLNLLRRINRELGGTFDLDGFVHEARFNRAHGRIEMHLVSRAPQSVTIADRRFEIAAGETIHTENSHKYSPAEFAHLAGEAGWTAAKIWTDRDKLFSVHYLRND